MGRILYSGTELPITSREVYDVTLETGEIKTFESWEDLIKFTKDYEWNKHVLYMDYLGIPKEGTLLIKCINLCTPKVIIMHNRKCVAYGYMRNNTILPLRTTEWKDTHIHSIPFDEICSNLSDYQKIWESTFENTKSAFREHWGNREDGMIEFQYQLGNTDKNSIEIIKL